MIFTSIDVRPITKDRIHFLDPKIDAPVRKQLDQIGCEVFREFGLATLTRMDIRADDAGDLFILEAQSRAGSQAREGRRNELDRSRLPEANVATTT